MLGGRWNGAALGRANPYIPLAVIAMGGGVFLSVSRPIGSGLAIGAVLAFGNVLFLSGRVDLAAATGDLGRAMVVMQIGMFTAFVLIGVVIVVLVHFSLAMAVAAAGGFAATQLGMLAAYYWTRGRGKIASGRQTT
jgi:hypothetical protein